jgi:hypothetical protein
LYPSGDAGAGVPAAIRVEARSGRSTVKLTVPPGGVVVYK